MHDDPPMAVFFMAPMILAILFIGLPWLILHYVTKWRQAPASRRRTRKCWTRCFTSPAGSKSVSRPSSGSSRSTTPKPVSGSTTGRWMSATI